MSKAFTLTNLVIKNPLEYLSYKTSQLSFINDQVRSFALLFVQLVETAQITDTESCERTEGFK